MTEFKVGDRVIHAHGRRMGLVERVEDDGASVRWDGMYPDEPVLFSLFEYLIPLPSLREQLKLTEEQAREFAELGGWPGSVLDKVATALRASSSKKSGAIPGRFRAAAFGDPSTQSFISRNGLISATASLILANLLLLWAVGWLLSVGLDTPLARTVAVVFAAYLFINNVLYDWNRWKQ